MTATTTPSESSNPAESSLRAKMTAALEHQAQVQGVAIDHATGVVDVAVGLPGDLAGPELDIRYTWVQWNLESLIAHAFPAKGLRLGQVHII
ncbi:hypothetical protein [Nocardioides sp.]|uniref:hypothetical protein n=1 Tax=Nocardioides sp. TaxID=35761 RepID=UPI002D7ECD82|nr:hypothetical protein [Nocardioides sp.]HET8959944.1 hypothetical protein [Nocardioides sp.]